MHFAVLKKFTDNLKQRILFDSFQFYKRFCAVDPIMYLFFFQIFLNSKLQKHEHDEDFNQHEFSEKYKETWKNLSSKKKACWIRIAKEEEQKYLVGCILLLLKFNTQEL